MKNIPDAWHSRGYLPHLNQKHLSQFVTFRLWDSLPKEQLVELEVQIAGLPPLLRDSSRVKKIEKWIDSGAGSCLLREPQVARIVCEAVMFGDGRDYIVEAYVVMPNHLHLLLTLIGDLTLSEIMQRIKSYTSHRINKLLGRNGSVWWPDYYDRYIRDAAHFEATVHYIWANPVRAGLADHPEAWPWTWVRK